MTNPLNKHLLDIASLPDKYLEAILQRTAFFAAEPREGIQRHQGRCIVNLFYENSTRTRVSFELAAKRLGADVINVDIAASSVKKGETLSDTVRTINALGVDALILRHAQSRAPHEIASLVDGSVINAGDGINEHPTQALLDAFTIQQRKGGIAGLTIAICGDIRHSRVAHSNIHCLSRLGAKIRLIAPQRFLPTEDYQPANVTCHTDMAEGLAGADVVMMLRIQFERIEGEPQPDIAQYRADYCLDQRLLKLANPDAFVMHPGPMNRMVEIADTVADDAQKSAILAQVKNGVFARMAVLDLLLTRSL